MKRVDFVSATAGAAAAAVFVLLALQFLAAGATRDAASPVAGLAVAASVAAFFVSASRRIDDLRRSLDRLTRKAEAAERGRREADEANFAKSAFIADVGARMRAPLNGVLGQLGLLESSDTERTRRESVAVAARLTENLLSLVDDAMDFARLEHRRLELEEEDFSPAELLDDVVRLTAPRAAEAGNVVNVHVAADLAPWLRGDPLRIRRILLSLTANALNLTNAGVIDIRLFSFTAADGATMLEGEVADTGVGLAPEDVAGLTHADSPVRGASARRFAGTGAGLGLAVCGALCELMGGGLTVGGAPGTGCVVAFRIRCRPPSQPHPETAEHGGRGSDEPAGAQPRSASMRILVVDDVGANRMLLGALLRREGHEPHFAGDGREAVRELVRDRYDLALMDIQMPVLDGVSATQAIRELDGQTATMPIIAVTANRDAAERERCLAAGMDDCLYKPVRRDALADVLARFAPTAEMGRGGRLSAVSPPPHASTSLYGGDLLDEEQIDSLRAVLDAQDWPTYVEAFAEAAQAQIAAAALALTEGRPLKTPAHTLKGVAVNVGARKAAEMAKLLETCPEEEAHELLAALPDVLARSLAALNAVAAAAGDAPKDAAV